jgi:hypothetical protein
MPLLEEDERYAVARSAKRFVHFSWTARIDISSIDGSSIVESSRI